MQVHEVMIMLKDLYIIIHKVNYEFDLLLIEIIQL
jgi:hypothetical protein